LYAGGKLEVVDTLSTRQLLCTGNCVSIERRKLEFCIFNDDRATEFIDTKFDRLGVRGCSIMDLLLIAELWA
jgi:hypothetical protein